MSDTASCAVLIAASALATEGPRLIQLLPMGRIELRDGRGPYELADLSHARQVIAATQAHAGRTDLMIDYDHQSVFGAKAGVGGQAPAAGWVKASSLQARPDGIWGEVEWTEPAAAKLAAREYRYLSPLFGVGAGGRIAKIFNAGLTNTPAIDSLAAVAASQEGLKVNPEKELRTLLGLSDTSGMDAVVEAVRTLQAEKIAASANPSPAEFVPMAVFEEVTAQLNKRNRGLTLEAANAKIDQYVAAGRLMPSLRAWALDLCERDAPALDAFVERTGSFFGAITASAERRGLPPRSGPTTSDIDAEIARNLGIKPEDMAAAGETHR